MKGERTRQRIPKLFPELFCIFLEKQHRFSDEMLSLGQSRGSLVWTQHCLILHMSGNSSQTFLNFSLKFCYTLPIFELQYVLHVELYQCNEVRHIHQKFQEYYHSKISHEFKFVIKYYQRSQMVFPVNNHL